MWQNDIWRDREARKDKLARIKNTILISLLILFILFAFFGCRSIDRVEVRTDTLTIEKLVAKHDTIFQNKTHYLKEYVYDSLYVCERNDTVYVTKWRNRDLVEYIHDSIYISKNDSVKEDRKEVKTEAVKEVVTKKEGFLQKIQDLAFFVGIILLVVWAVRIYVKCK